MSRPRFPINKPTQEAIMRNTIITTATLAILFVSMQFTSEVEAQNFNRRVLFRSGIPNVDMVPNQRTPRHHIRNNRILGDGSLQFLPQAFVPRNGGYRQPAYTPPVFRPPVNRFSAGPTVGGRFRIVERPKPQATQQPASGWQPWMHVPLDGSQPWKK